MTFRQHVVKLLTGGSHEFDAVSDDLGFRHGSYSRMELTE
jgi:hypothetical protein